MSDSSEKNTRSRRRTRKVKEVEPLPGDVEVGIAGTVEDDILPVATQSDKSSTERISVPAEHASATVQQALTEPGVRKIVIKNEAGDVIWQAHPAIGAGTGALLLLLAGLPGALTIAAIAGVITLVGRVQIEITRDNS